ncbi:MAG: hypothetical protein MZV65_34065 [Chromatiales bacterium]|nr:hypothetical protein [Chromatiales bacterium]
MTANQRLARHLAAGYGAARQREGAAVLGGARHPAVGTMAGARLAGVPRTARVRHAATAAHRRAGAHAVGSGDSRCRQPSRCCRCRQRARGAREAWQLLHAYRLRLPQGAGEVRAMTSAAFKRVGRCAIASAAREPRLARQRAPAGRGAQRVCRRTPAVAEARCWLPVSTS